MRKSYLPTVISIFACLEMVAGIVSVFFGLLSFSRYGMYVFIGIGLLLSCILTFGFAKVVEAADEYLRRL